MEKPTIYHLKTATWFLALLTFTDAQLDFIFHFKDDPCGLSDTLANLGLTAPHPLF